MSTSTNGDSASNAARGLFADTTEVSLAPPDDRDRRRLLRLGLSEEAITRHFAALRRDGNGPFSRPGEPASTASQPPKESAARSSGPAGRPVDRLGSLTARGVPNVGAAAGGGVPPLARAAHRCTSAPRSTQRGEGLPSRAPSPPMTAGIPAQAAWNAADDLHTRRRVAERIAADRAEAAALEGQLRRLDQILNGHNSGNRSSTVEPGGSPTPAVLGARSHFSRHPVPTPTPNHDVANRSQPRPHANRQQQEHNARFLSVGANRSASGCCGLSNSSCNASKGEPASTVAEARTLSVDALAVIRAQLVSEVAALVAEKEALQRQRAVLQGECHALAVARDEGRRQFEEDALVLAQARRMLADEVAVTCLASESDASVMGD